MKRLLFVILFAASAFLSACTQVVYEGPKDDVNNPGPTADFSVVMTEARYNELGGISADFSEEESITTAQVDENLRFVVGHGAGPQFVHIRVYNPKGEVVEEVGPVEDWDGLSADRYSLGYTPETAGRVYF